MLEVILYGPLIPPLSKEQLQSRLPSPALRVAVDGGSHAPVEFDLWCGDGDSGQPPRGVPYVQKETQDETDLCFALRHLKPNSWTHLHLVGFLGGRKDHELSVLGELHAALRKETQKTAMLYNQRLEIDLRVLSPGSYSLKLNGTFSVLSLEETRVSLLGDCEYQTDEVTLLPLSGRGISNFATGRVQITCSRPIFVFEIQG